MPPFNHAGFYKLSNSNKFKITWKGGTLFRAKEFEIRGLTELALVMYYQWIRVAKAINVAVG